MRLKITESLITFAREKIKIIKILQIKIPSHLYPDLELTGVIPVAVNEGEAAIVVVLNRTKLLFNLLLANMCSRTESYY
jgi:hypothetical protein